MNDIKFSRGWSMPNKDTFSIRPIRNLIRRYIDKIIDEDPFGEPLIIDPFVGKSPFKDVCFTNDLDPSIDSQFHIDATDFLEVVKTDFGSVDMVLYDPPYSPRQVSEVYKKLGTSVNMQTAQSSYWAKHKKIISQIVRKGGYVITCGWNSGGIGKTNDFEIVEILLVPHGDWHNDTVVTVERKL